MERRIPTLIVDDEPVARRLLREELELLSEIDVIGEAGNGREAAEMIAGLKPELVFLDLQMPVMSGFEVVRGLAGSSLPVISSSPPSTSTPSRPSRRGPSTTF